MHYHEDTCLKRSSMYKNITVRATLKKLAIKKAPHENYL